jgi:hypothetical protein
MKQIQELYDHVIENIIKQTAREQVERLSNGNMRLYHAGQIYAFKAIADSLIIHHGCKAKFFETDEPKENSHD